MWINARKEKEKISCVQDEQVEKVNNLLSLGAKVSVKGKRPDKRYIYIYIYKGLGKLGVPFKVWSVWNTRGVGNLLKIGERRRHFELPSQNDE